MVKEVSFLILFFCLGIISFAQENFIRNGGFEDLIGGKSNKDFQAYSKNMRYWKEFNQKKFKVDYGKEFIYKKERNLAIFNCSVYISPYEQENIVVKQFEGKYSAEQMFSNVEEGDRPQHAARSYLFSMDYILNELSPYRKMGSYELSFHTALQQYRSEFYAANSDDKGVRQIVGNCDTCLCDTSYNDSLKLTILFTNTAPEGKLYTPSADDVFIDTLLQNHCDWRQYTFNFNLEKWYKYFVIGYLPKERKADHRVCRFDMNIAYDCFKLIYLDNSKEN